MPSPPGVPLGEYMRHHPAAGVEISCNGCKGRRVISMDQAAARLRARGIEPRTFGIKALAKLIETPCRCGAMRWETRPAFEHVTPAQREELKRREGSDV